MVISDYKFVLPAVIYTDLYDSDHCLQWNVKDKYSNIVRGAYSRIRFFDYTTNSITLKSESVIYFNINKWQKLKSKLKQLKRR